MDKRCTHNRHRWLREETGCKENPGVWGIGGAAIKISEYCPHCRATRYKIVGDVNDYGNRNCGWKYSMEDDNDDD
jgi:hypothetical protein